jgi:hypothetical protein
MESDVFLEEEESTGNHQEEDSAGRPLPGANTATGGQRMLSIIIGIFSCVVAAPLLLIYFIKSPPPLQDVYTFGISYYNLVFIFLISAVGLIISLLFFLKFRLSVIIAIFITSLFCCVPLIMGLKNDLTLQQAILNVSFFSGWPFFLRPLYIFIELLLPMGVLIFLFLQLKSIFSRKPHVYTFLGAAFYLTAAAFIGFSGLIQAGQPNIMTALTKHDYASGDRSTALEKLSENSADSVAEVPLSGALSPGSQGEIAGQSGDTPEKNALQVKDSEVAMLGQKVGLLKGKTDRISKESEQVGNPLTGKEQSAPVSLKSPPHAVPQNVQPSHEGVLAEINHNLGLLSNKINQVAESLETLKNPVIEPQQSTIDDVKQKMELLTAKLDKLLSRLNQTGYFTTQQQGYTDKRSVVPSSITKDQNITSSELASVLQKIEILSNKIDLISDTLAKRDLYVPEGEK